MSERYSVWALPHEETKTELATVIARLSRLYGGPVFEPHLTVLGDVSRGKSRMVEVVERIAGEIAGLTFTLGEVSFSTTYFQSVFVRLVASTELMELNLLTKKLLGVENSVYMPHVSLIYGDHSMDMREKIARTIRLHNKVFDVCELAVVPSTENPAEWGRVLSVPIKGA